MCTLFTKGLLAASISAVLFLGGIPEFGSWDDGMSAVGQAYAAGGRGRGAGSGGGGHDGGSHSDSSHDDSHTDHDDGSDHDHDDGGHDSSSGSKGKGPQYRGGRVGSRGKGGPDRTVVEKIFESE